MNDTIIGTILAAFIVTFLILAAATLDAGGE